MAGKRDRDVDTARRRRWHRLALLGMVVLFGARAGWWVATSEVPTPVDESAHYAYVQSLADGHYPVTGRDHVGVDTISLLKRDPAASLRSLSYPPRPAAVWGLANQQYEAFQPPLYYLLSVPVYAAGRSISLLAAIYALRIWTVLLVAAAIPLLYLAGRELFADQPAVWLLGPLVLSGVEMVASSLSQVTNDAIMVPLGAGVLWTLGRYFDRPSIGRASIVGVGLGLALLGKTTGLALVAAAGVALVGLLASRKGGRLQILAGAGAAAVVTALIISPWLALNWHSYHSVTGIGANGKLVLPLTGRLPRTAAEVRSLIESSRQTLWTSELVTAPGRSYGYLWEWTAAITVVGGSMAAVLRRQVARAMTILWLALMTPLCLALLVWALFAEADGLGGVVGRHLAVALPALCLAMAAGAVQLLSSRLAPIGVLGALTAAGWIAVGAQRSYLASTYAAPVFGRTAPLVDQSWSDGTVVTTGIEVAPGCAAGYVGVATPRADGVVVGPAAQPPAVSVGSTALDRVGADQNFAVYRLGATTRTPFILTFTPPAYVERSASARPAAFRFVSPPAGGSPAMRVYCQVTDPASVRFAVLEHPGHPPLSYRSARAWPLVSPLVYGAATLGAGITAVVAPGRRRRRPRHLRSTR